MPMSDRQRTQMPPGGRCGVVGNALGLPAKWGHDAAHVRKECSRLLLRILFEVGVNEIVHNGGEHTP